MKPSATRYIEIVVDANKRKGFRSLASAVEKSVDGATIYLQPGEYVLKGKITKSLTIIGCGNNINDVVVKVPFNEPVTIGGGRCEFQNIRILSSDNGSYGERRYAEKPLVMLGEGATLKSAYCKWSHFDGWAIVASPNTTVECEHCVFDECEAGGVLLNKETIGVFENCGFSSYYSSGIKFTGQKLNVTSCYFSQSWIDGDIRKDAEVSIQNCDFTKMEEHDLKFRGSGTLSVLGSRFFENDDDGLRVSGEIQLKVSQCSFHDQRETGLLVLGNVDAQIEDCTFRGNKRGLLLNSKFAAQVSRCLFQANYSVGASICDGQVQLNQCEFDSKTALSAEELEHEGYNDEAWTLGLIDLPVGLQVSGQNVNLLARDCIWQMKDSVEITHSGRAMFRDCQFESLLRGVIVSGANARFYSCTFKEARHAGLCVLDNAVVEVDRCEITKSPYGLIIGQSGILTLTTSQIVNINLAGIYTAADAKTTARQCHFENIKQNAVEMLGNARVFAAECRFSNTGVALKVAESGSFQMKSCDFRETYRSDRFSKSKKSVIGGNQFWTQELSPSALNQIEKHINFENCRFPEPKAL